MSTDPRRPAVAEIKAGPDGKGSIILHGLDDNPEGLDISSLVSALTVYVEPENGRTGALVRLSSVVMTAEAGTVELDAMTKAALLRMGWTRK